jgi:DNA-binding NarL/FixJ family response regulator
MGQGSDPAAPLRVFILDDHAVVRHGLASMIEGQPGFALAGQAGTAEAALDALGGGGVADVVLVDLRLPGVGGIEFIARARERWPNLRFVVLTTFDLDEDITQAFAVGAHAYLLKDTGGDELFRVLEAVAGGQSVVTPEIAARLATRASAPALSPREREILTLVAQGESNREIARRLQIGEATVKTHLLHVFEKLDAPDRASAVATAMARGIIQP